MHVLLSLLGKGFTCAVKTGFHVLTAARTHPRSEKKSWILRTDSAPARENRIFACGVVTPARENKNPKKIKIKIIETLAAAAVRRHRSRRRHHSSSRCRRRHISSLSPSRHGERRRGASPPDPGHLIVVVIVRGRAGEGSRRWIRTAEGGRGAPPPDPSGGEAPRRGERRRGACRRILAISSSLLLPPSHGGGWKRGGAAASGGRRAGEGHCRGIRAAERPLTCPRVHQLEILFLFPQATSPGPPAAFSHGRRDWGGRREKERKNGWPYLSAALGWWRLHVNICVIPSRTLEAWIYLASLGA